MPPMRAKKPRGDRPEKNPWGEFGKLQERNSCAPVFHAWRQAVTTAATPWLLDLAKERACEVGAGAWRVATDRRFQASAASAVGGAMVGSVGGGAAGCTAGTLFGAAVGVVPAVFTFGLSIPIGAIIGGSSGLAVGSVLGGSVGFGAGGALGYTVSSRRVRSDVAVPSVAEAEHHEQLAHDIAGHD